MTLTIEHTEAEGTLLHGTSRGDGSAEVVKRLGWRWGRSIGMWFVPRSRDAAPKRPLIEQTADQLRRIAREWVEDLAADGVVYGEARWAPEQHTRGGLSLTQAVEAVGAGLADGMAAATASGTPFVARQLVTSLRHTAPNPEVVELAVAGEHLVAGFDLAGPEDGFPASAHRPALDLLAAHRIPVTLHAGEAAGAESMADALDSGRALRLGHGVRLLDEDREAVSPLARWIRDRRIALEVCPCSNLQTGACAAWGEDTAAHPVTRMLRDGFAVTISPDNRLMSGTSVSHELQRLRQEAGWTPRDELQVQRNAARAAFVPLAYQQWLERHVTGEDA